MDGINSGEVTWCMDEVIGLVLVLHSANRVYFIYAVCGSDDVDRCMCAGLSWANVLMSSYVESEISLESDDGDLVVSVAEAVVSPDVSLVACAAGGRRGMDTCYAVVSVGISVNLCRRVWCGLPDWINWIGECYVA